ncbi:hypothetical protein GUITHDRAFT_119181 [Guillardia theta CCMP2712]|uniref:EamA domain-containing protein n=2 Tax=Guillardia theta TaxID=55529 RepID=L1IED8_GUITC|nr:hypothetical protein GUITHDRAFT_119181 [Guillardia theta CCMP2712]EKX34636.1 hypothetical protein GUITHDRAFT_119181 [Guillardia theta CCMP2712]|mmetsp:Transcript_1044/g.3250  ORF Transcript_1044/g.3250 Transcript_1044/m.3250 type:complete len:363 (+) Transcript_1044:36-1124(+)|eukprot:XP_005821616.1 hypothetical protein GUITHDRAFT_119181 [Guillardia theta CCMP2712]
MNEEKPLLGIAPRLGDQRFYQMLGLAFIAILTIGLRMNFAKMASVYDPELGHGSEEGGSRFSKPLFFASTYFLGKILILPFCNWSPRSLPRHIYYKIFVMVSFGAVGGMLEYSSMMFLPVSIVVMVRAAGLVAFTALGSAYISQRSPMNPWIALSLLLVIGGSVLACFVHVHTSAVTSLAIVGIVLVVLSTMSDGLEQVVAEIALQERSMDVDVYVFTGVSGLMGCGIMFAVLFMAQLLPGSDGEVLEDSLGTISAIFSDWILGLLILGTILMSLFEMIAATAINKYFGATTKESVLSFRIVGAWGISLLIFAILPGSGFGEPFDGGVAVLKLVGGALIIAGILFYVHNRRSAEDEELAKET